MDKRDHRFVCVVLGTASEASIGYSREHLYISVDVEAAGRNHADHSMLSLGACVVGDSGSRFYAVLKPVNDNYDVESMDVLRPTHLSMGYAKEHGLEPKEAMARFEEWILKACGDKKPLFAAYPLSFDWCFVATYLGRYLGRNVFGFAAFDMKSYFGGMMRRDWADTSKSDLADVFPPKTKHTHHALMDAIEQAEICEQMLKAPR